MLMTKRWAAIRLDVGRMGNAMSNAYIGAHFLNGDNNNSTTIADPDPLMEYRLW
jgi:hypothetical protein